MNSSTVANTTQFDKTHYNSVRQDGLIQAGEHLDSTGTNNAFVLTIDDNVNTEDTSNKITSIVTGHKFKFKSNIAVVDIDTNIPTLEIKALSDGSTLLAATSLKLGKSGKLENNCILNGMIVEAVYNGTNFEIVSNVYNFNEDFHGSGKDGALNILAGQTVTLDTNRIYEYTSIDIAATGKLTASAAGSIFLKCHGDFNNAGEVDFSEIDTTLTSVSFVYRGELKSTPGTQLATTAGDGGGSSSSGGIGGSNSGRFSGGGGGGIGGHSWNRVIGGGGGDGGNGGATPADGTGASPVLGTSDGTDGADGAQSAGGGGGSGASYGSGSASGGGGDGATVHGANGSIGGNGSGTPGYHYKGGGGGGGGGAGGINGKSGLNLYLNIGGDLNNTGTIITSGEDGQDGGNGGNGGNFGGTGSGNDADGGSGGGGGGGGGAGNAGDISIYYYGTLTSYGTMAATAGTGGLGGSGGNPGTPSYGTPVYYGDDGEDGENGNSGTIVVVKYYS